MSPAELQELLGVLNVGAASQHRIKTLHKAKQEL